MKNLTYIGCNEINEFDSIVRSKNHPRRAVLTAMRPDITNLYDSYLNRFSNIPRTATFYPAGPQKEAIHHCYDVSTKALEDLIYRIRTGQTDEFQFTCPSCLIKKPDENDHYIPKESYAEFSVLAKNLVPICETCNKIKNDLWLENGERAFLHFYIDPIPGTQFLFCTMRMIDDVPIVSWELRNVGNTIDRNLYDLISRHFRRLNLFDRYNEGIKKVVSDIKIDVRTWRRQLRVDSAGIVDLLLEKSHEKEILYGVNYWEAILMRELASSVDFINSL